jgi:monoamine oxidase
MGGGKIAEIGGEYLGDLQARLTAFASEFGVEKFNTYNTGNNIYYRN